MLTSTNKTWIASVRFMRVATPVAAIASIIIAVYAWKHERYAAMGISSALFGANVMLVWINWFVLSMPKKENDGDGCVR